MNQTVTILILTIFTLISCSENKSGAKKTDFGETPNKHKSEAKNAEMKTSDEFTPNNFNDIHAITHTNELNLYRLHDLEENTHKKVGFISLSDIYPLSEDPDSLAIPNLENVNKEKLQYFKLATTYRKRFLAKTNTSEKDSVFIYDYSADVLVSFSVRKLNVVAYLNYYIDIDECPCDQDSYMIGFEIDKNYLTAFGKYYSEALVFVGKENPFTQGQMKPIVWQKINAKKFPIEKSNLSEIQKQAKHKNAIRKQAYVYETDHYQFFIQDCTEPTNRMQVQDRHLIVLDKQKGNVVNEILYIESEGISITPLNFGINNPTFFDLKEQWTGKLFKNKPEVIFGFEWLSFGCPSIIFVNSQDNYIEINCDNRH